MFFFVSAESMRCFVWLFVGIELREAFAYSEDMKLAVVITIIITAKPVRIAAEVYLIPWFVIYQLFGSISYLPILPRSFLT